MFETAELGRKLSKSDAEAVVPELRTSLLRAQFALEDQKFPVIIYVNGQDAAGRSETVNLLHEWLDARYLVYEPFDEPTAAERARPEYWRYWMALPPRGKIGIFSGSYYREYIERRVDGGWTDFQLDTALQHANAFERALADDGALIIKLWLHIARKRQKKRLEKLEKSSATKWRVSKTDWARYEKYDEYRRVSERVVRQMSTGYAPWTVIESADSRYRNVSVAQHVLEEIGGRMRSGESRAPAPLAETDIDPDTILDRLDLSKSISKKDYSAELEKLQARINRLSRKAFKAEKSSILVFEGWDAAGKGGSIRRLIHAIDARHYRVIPIAAPTDEEKAHHYLWRFWRHLPRPGRTTIYDRSWYGRVLVERVEGFADEQEWRRAYKEVNDFEEALVDHGIVLIKYWLHVSQEEQLRRFKEREEIPWKRYKITEEDYRNRSKANLYEAAVSEMIGRTSTEYAPWKLVEAENKHYGRLVVLRTYCERLEEALG